MHSIDISAYCRRIGYSGEVAPTMAVLKSLIEHHTRSVPFENLDVLLGRPIELAPEALERKIVHNRRGGYCFEQNGFLLHVLEAIGFRVAPISARVRLVAPRGTTPARTHCFLRVEIDGQSWLVDVGIGAFSPTAPLLLVPDLEQPTLHEPRRITFEEGKYFHQTKLGDSWSDVCEFTLEEMPLIDRELANWFTSTHPNSPFRNALMVARAGSNGDRYSLQNSEFTHRRGGEILSTKQIADPDQLLECLLRDFGLSFAPGTRFQLPGASPEVKLL
jgi:N-hydroxyarylamine O-acetyltransferase